MLTLFSPLSKHGFEKDSGDEKITHQTWLIRCKKTYFMMRLRDSEHREGTQETSPLSSSDTCADGAFRACREPSWRGAVELEEIHIWKQTELYTKQAIVESVPIWLSVSR